MTIEQILERQELILQQDMSNFRKKVCRKGFEIISKENGVPDDQARIITLMVDGMVKTRYPDERESYINVIKKIFRAIRVKFRPLPGKINLIGQIYISRRAKVCASKGGPYYQNFKSTQPFDSLPVR